MVSMLPSPSGATGLKRPVGLVRVDRVRLQRELRQVPKILDQAAEGVDQMHASALVRKLQVLTYSYETEDRPRHLSGGRGRLELPLVRGQSPFQSTPRPE